MRLRLRLLNLYLRLVMKRSLRRMRDPAQMRAAFELTASRHFSAPEGSHFVEERLRRSSDAELMAALWCSRGRPDRRKVVLYLHGGAYLAGSSATHRHLGAALAGAAGVRLLLPEYRLAPEHPFPAALDDALIAYTHLLDAGYEPHAIALAGDSAGGGLALALLLRLALEGLPRPGCAVVFSPWADMTGRAGSLRRNERRDVLLPVRRLPEVVGFYLDGHDPSDPLASPVLGDWRDPPPVLLMASRSEILLDDATGMAEVLRRAGGDVRLELWHGLPHAWPVFAGLLREADAAVEQAGAFLARHLNAEPDQGAG